MSDTTSNNHTTASLFQVYLRLKPAVTPATGAHTEAAVQERYLRVEEANSADAGQDAPTHITVIPPVDSRRRAVEKFAFTRVFQEEASQLDVFQGTNLVSLIEGVLAPEGKRARDGLIATLGVTGSGKSHTMLGSPSQRGLTQLALDVLYRSLGDQIQDPTVAVSLMPALAASEASEAQIIPACVFLDGPRREGSVDPMSSRAQTPMTIGRETPVHSTSVGLYPALHGQSTGYHPRGKDILAFRTPFSNGVRTTRSMARSRMALVRDGSININPSQYRRHALQRRSALPQTPAVDGFVVSADKNADYAVLISMYEVYNDRIFDLLVGHDSYTASSANSNGPRRRPLLFKSTELSPDKKVVAGLRKIICATLDEALMVLEAGLTERRVAGTGSNSISSRSHGFFCLEVQKRRRRAASQWTRTSLTIVDLAGSERARNAKTAGATLAEAGKINESLMYLGQCLQMQSDRHEGNKATVVPFRQCKLTELLFSNSFPGASFGAGQHQQPSSTHDPQRAIMIVTADPLGDFNATSQILRYSALAREVTIPRVPSVASTILSSSSKTIFPSGRTTPTLLSSDEVVFAAQEITRLTEEIEGVNVRLLDEQNHRRETELALEAAQERWIVMEQAIREECWAESEARLEEERERWKLAWCEEADRNDEHLDKKLEGLARTIQIYEDPDVTVATQLEELEAENNELRRRLDLAEREIQCRSPTKTATKKKKSNNKNKNKINTLSFELANEASDHLMTMTLTDDSDVENVSSQMNEVITAAPRQLPVESPSPKPKPSVKRQRKLTTRKWDLAPDDSF